MVINAPIDWDFILPGQKYFGGVAKSRRDTKLQIVSFLITK